MCVTHIMAMTQVLDIKALRKSRGWTQEQMAQHFGVDKATVWRWEKGGVPDRGVTRVAIETEFGIRAGDDEASGAAA